MSDMPTMTLRTLCLEGQDCHHVLLAYAGQLFNRLCHHYSILIIFVVLFMFYFFYFCYYCFCFVVVIGSMRCR